MDDIGMSPCYDLCWWAIPVLEKGFCWAQQDPGGLVTVSTCLDWVIDLELEAM